MASGGLLWLFCCDMLLNRKNNRTDRKNKRANRKNNRTKRTGHKIHPYKVVIRYPLQVYSVANNMHIYIHNNILIEMNIIMYIWYLIEGSLMVKTSA